MEEEGYYLDGYTLLLEIYAEFFLERSNHLQVSFVNSSHETGEGGRSVASYLGGWVVAAVLLFVRRRPGN